MSDDFYVGYSPKAPPALGRRTTRVAIGLVLAGLAAGTLLMFEQPRFASSKFEYGVHREYSGVIAEWPYPILRTRGASFILVAPGKHGLSAPIRGLDGKSVHLQGSLIERGPDRMLEVRPGSLQQTASTGGVPASHQPLELGAVSLQGEIVDSKCYLGVMNPGNGKVHRDCAVRCISGGAPPAFVATDAAGEMRVLLLVGADGRQLNHEILSYVGEPIGIRGELVRSGSQLILKADPARFQRQTGIKSPA